MLRYGKGGRQFDLFGIVMSSTTWPLFTGAGNSNMTEWTTPTSRLSVEVVPASGMSVRRSRNATWDHGVLEVRGTRTVSRLPLVGIEDEEGQVVGSIWTDPLPGIPLGLRVVSLRHHRIAKRTRLRISLTGLALGANISASILEEMGRTRVGAKLRWRDGIRVEERGMGQEAAERKKPQKEFFLGLPRFVR